MATLEEALQGLNYTGADTGYGIAAQSLGQVTPKLINPYASTSEAVGISLGSVLLQSLLGYQARQQAAKDTLELNTLANQMNRLTTPEARTEFIGGVSDPMNQARLSTLSTALTAQDTARKIDQANKLADLTTSAEFQLGPLGTKVFERDIAKEIARQSAITGGFQSRQELADQLMKERNVQRKLLGLQDVDVPNTILQRAIEKNASSDLALDVASTIDNYKSIPEFAAAKNISAFGDDQLKSRLRNLATIVLQSRSGLAATDRERENLNKILTGDFTAVSPDTVSGILKRFARDEKTIAADTVAAATQRPEAFVGELRSALQEGRQTQFETRVPNYNLSTTQPQTFVKQKEDKLQKLQQLQQTLAELRRQKAAAGK